MLCGRCQHLQAHWPLKKDRLTIPGLLRTSVPRPCNTHTHLSANVHVSLPPSTSSEHWREQRSHGVQVVSFPSFLLKWAGPLDHVTWERSAAKLSSRFFKTTGNNCHALPRSFASLLKASTGPRTNVQFRNTKSVSFPWGQLIDSIASFS